MEDTSVYQTSVKKIRLDNVDTEDDDQTEQKVEYMEKNTKEDEKEQIAGEKIIEPPNLPEGWVIVRHVSGADLYLHKMTRTCTLSRPFTVPENRTVKNHKIHVDAIPCLKEWLFRKNRSSLASKWHEASKGHFGQLVKLEPQRVKEYLNLRWTKGMPMSSTREEKSLAADEVRRKRKSRKQEPSNAPAVPENISKMVDVMVPKCYRKPNPGNGKVSPALWKVNSLSGPVSLLYEFCEHYLRADLDFICKETEDPTSPYLSTAVIGGSIYGSGSGSSKKAAKRAAADSTMHLFLPDSYSRISSIPKPITKQEFEFLSSVEITDPKAVDILSQAGLPSPWQILRECCQRNRGSGRISEPILNIELRHLEKQSLEPSTVMLNPSGPFAETSRAPDPSKEISSVSDPSVVQFQCNQSIENSFSKTDVFASPSLTPGATQGSSQTDKSGVQSWYHLKCGDSLEVSGPCLGRKHGQQVSAQAMLKLIHPYIYSWDALLKLYADSHSSFMRVTEERESNNLSYLSKTENSELLEQLRTEMRKLASQSKGTN